MNIFNLIQGRLGRFVPYDSPTRQVFNGVKKMSFLVLVLVGLITMAGSPFVEAAIVMGPDIDPDFNSVEKERAQPSVNPTPNPYPAPELSGSGFRGL